MHDYSMDTFVLSENAEGGATRERSSKDADEVFKNNTERYDSDSSIFMSSKTCNEHLKEEDNDLSTIQNVYERNVSLKELDLTISAKNNNIGNHSYLPAQDTLESEITNSFCTDEELTRDDQDNVHSHDDDEADVLSFPLASPGQRSKSSKGTMGETNQVISPTEEKISQNGSQTTDSAQPGVQVAAKNAGEETAHVQLSPFPYSGIQICGICIICGYVLFMCIHKKRKYWKNELTEADFTDKKKLQKKNYPSWNAEDTSEGPKDASILKSTGNWPFQLTEYEKMINLIVPVLFQGLYKTLFDETFIVGPKTHVHTLYPHENAKVKTASFQSAEKITCGTSGLGVLDVEVNPVIPSFGRVASKNANNCIKRQPENDEKHDRSSSIPPSASSNNPQSVYTADFSTRIPERCHNNIPLSETLTEERRPRLTQETVEYYLERSSKSGGRKPTSGNHLTSHSKEEVWDSFKSDINESGGPVEGSEPKQEERRDNRTENCTNNGASGAVSGDQGASADIRGSNSTSAGSSGDDDDDDDEDNRNRQKHVDHKQEGCQRRKIKKNRQEEEEKEKEEEEDNDSSFDRDGETCQRDDLDDQFDVSRQLAAEHPMSRQLATSHPMSRQLATRHPMFMSRQHVIRLFLLRQLATGHPMSRQQPTRHLAELILASNSPLWLLLYQNLFSTSSRWLQNLSIITVSPSAGPCVLWNNCYQTTLTEQLRAGQNFSHATLTGLLINHNCHSTLGLERIHIYFILTGQCRAGQSCCHAICTGPSGVCPVYWPAQLGCFYCEILWLLVGCLQSSFCPMQEEELSWHSLPSQICFQFPLAEGSHTIWVSGWVFRETESSHVLCILPSVPSRTPSLESFSQFLARDSYPLTYSGTRSLLPHGHISMDTANSAIHNQQALSEMLLRVLAEISTVAPLASVLSNQALASNSTQCFQSEAGRRNRCPQRVLRECCGEISAVHSSRHNERSVHMYNCGQDSIVNEVNATTGELSERYFFLLFFRGLIRDRLSNA